MCRRKEKNIKKELTYVTIWCNIVKVSGEETKKQTQQIIMRPIGQAVKTPPFHGGNTSSILVWVIVSLSNKSRGVAQFG